jgi:hypothetical protein
MTKKQWVLLAVFILLAAVYICAFTNWGRRPAIQISHAADLKPRRFIRPNVNAGGVSTANVRFNLDHPCRLTEVKVVRLADWQTNKSTLPLWHLISDSNSVPTRRFYYGVPIRGMKPVVANIRPKPLETNVTYRLFLTAGPVKGQHDFSTLPKQAM